MHAQTINDPDSPWGVVYVFEAWESMSHAALSALCDEARPEGMADDVFRQLRKDWRFRVNWEAADRYGYNWQLTIGMCFTPADVEPGVLIKQLSEIVADFDPATAIGGRGRDP